MVNNKNPKEEEKKDGEEGSEQEENQKEDSDEEINLEQFIENPIESTDFKLEDLILESGETLPSLLPAPETEERNLEESLENVPAGERTEEPYTPNIQAYHENILYEEREGETKPIESRIIRTTLTEDIIQDRAFHISPHRETIGMIHTPEQEFHHEEGFDYEIKPKKEEREMPWETKSEVELKKYKPGK